MRLHVKCRLLFSDFNENLNFPYRFSENPHIKFHENPFSGSRVFLCGQTVRQDEPNSYPFATLRKHLKIHSQRIQMLIYCNEPANDV